MTKRDFMILPSPSSLSSPQGHGLPIQIECGSFFRAYGVPGHLQKDVFQARRLPLHGRDSSAEVGEQPRHELRAAGHLEMKFASGLLHLDAVLCGEVGFERRVAADDDLVAAE